MVLPAGTQFADGYHNVRWLVPSSVTGGYIVCGWVTLNVDSGYTVRRWHLPVKRIPTGGNRWYPPAKQCTHRRAAYSFDIYLIL